MRQITLSFLLIFGLIGFSQTIYNPALIGQANRNQYVGKGLQVTDSLIAKGRFAIPALIVDSNRNTVLNAKINSSYNLQFFNHIATNKDLGFGVTQFDTNEDNNTDLFHATLGDLKGKHFFVDYSKLNDSFKIGAHGMRFINTTDTIIGLYNDEFVKTLPCGGGGSISEPATQIVYGTGTGVTSSPIFTVQDFSGVPFVLAGNPSNNMQGILGTGQFNLYNPSNFPNKYEFHAPTSLSTSLFWYYPSNAGNSGDVLTTDGGGNLSWEDRSGKFPKTAKILTESRELDVTDLKQILYNPDNNTAIELTMPDPSPFIDGDLIAFASENDQSWIQVASTTPGDTAKLFTFSTTHQGGELNYKAEIALLVYSSGIGGFVPYTGCLKVDESNNIYHTSTKYLYDKLGSGFIKLSGTESGNPVIGDLEFDNNVNMTVANGFGDFNTIRMGASQIRLNVGDDTHNSQLVVRPSYTTVNSDPSDVGLTANSNYTQVAKTDSLAYVQYDYLKPQINQITAGSYTITPTKGSNYITFTGTSSTFTMPPVAGYEGQLIIITNSGSGTITLNSNTGGDDIWEGGTSGNTTTIANGSVYRLINDGTHYIIL